MQVLKYTEQQPEKKIAIIQTGCWGDNINSTLMLKPLREAFETSIIDVYTSTTYSSAFDNNPYIDNIIQYQSHDKNNALHLSISIPPFLKDSGYDIVFSPHPMFNPEYWTSLKHPDLGHNLIYAWVRALENADIKYELPLETILRLRDDEIKNVREYIRSVESFSNRRNILMEVQGESGQTHWGPQWTHATVKYLLKEPNTNIFISRKNSGNDVDELKSLSPGNVHFVGHLSIRECAELFNHCDAFLSVSSGLSNACNTNWCRKDIKWFEAINSYSVSSAPIRSTGKAFWCDNNLDGYLNLLRNNGM
jgi:ADP-heptose:LPS heptosyltransferase